MISLSTILAIGWTPIVALLGIALWLDARGVGAPALEHECEQCRYDLRGSRGSRCPECGASRASLRDG